MVKVESWTVISNPSIYIHPQYSATLPGTRVSTGTLSPWPHFPHTGYGPSKLFCTFENAPQGAWLLDFPCREAPRGISKPRKKYLKKKKKITISASGWMVPTCGSYPAARTGPPPAATMFAIFFCTSTSLCWLACTSCNNTELSKSTRASTMLKHLILYI